MIAAVGHFEQDTAVERIGPGRWRAGASAAWNIGENANGGYAVSPVLRAMAELAEHPDPLSVTAHFLRPLRPDGRDLEITAEVVRAGRSLTVMRASLAHDGADRIVVLGGFGDLTARTAPGVVGHVALAPPRLAPPEECVPRAELAQGVDLPILERVDVRIDPASAVSGERDDAVMAGWIRFADGEPPTARNLFLFADAFPPSVVPRLGAVGWVPTLEMTVHVRARPAPGWIAARFECDDLADGRMIESGSLWDATGRLVARSRQLGLVLGG